MRATSTYPSGIMES